MGNILKVFINGKILTINNFDKYKDEIDLNIGNKTSKEGDSDG
ncbi:hypothetical protein [Campylobacter pinnipediorum]|nr:hypothetical protein [Campylobacter pinnipediorum]